MAHAEQITAPVSYHGEGPCWSSSWGGLRFVDMLAGDLLTVDDDGRVHRTTVGSAVCAFVRPRRDGGYVVGTERGVALADSPFGPPSSPRMLWQDPDVRMNEGSAAPDGALYAGSMSYRQAPGAGVLYRIDPGGQVEVVLPEVTVSNGIGFAPDGRRAFYNDSATGRTDLFDVVDGRLHHRRPFVDHPDGGGVPDGLCLDTAGNVWVAMNGGAAVRCFSPDGALLDVVEVPVHQVTACTLGGPDLRTLYVTTSREKLGTAAEPAAGAVFAAPVAVPGQEPLPYAG